MKPVTIGLTVALQLAAITVYAQAAERSESATTTLQPIMVTAPAEAFTSAGIEADREEVQLTPGGVTLVEGDVLDERNISSMADMLRYVPGLFIVSDSGGSEIYFSSRGSNLDATDWDMNGIMLLQNGLPVTTADGNNHNRVLNPLSARYAIVARGANAMKYGASTLGGAINFISPTAYDLPDAVLSVNGGGHGQVQGRLTVRKVFDNGFDGLLSLGGSHRDGFREHSTEDEKSVYANVGWRMSPALGTRLYLTYIDSDVELAGALSRAELRDDYDQASEDARVGNYQRDVETWRLASKTTWQIAPNRRLDIGFSYERQDLYHPIVRDFGPGDSPFFDGLVIKTDHEDVGLMARYEHQVGDHNLLLGAIYQSGGVEGKNFGNNHGAPGDLQTLVDQEAETLRVYAMDRWHVGDRWTLIPGIQYVNADREISNITITRPAIPGMERIPGHTQGDYSSVNPRLGLIYHVRPEFELFANVSRIYEPPTFFELDDPTTAAVEDALEAMEGVSVEAGTRGEHDIGGGSSWHWDVSVYYSWLDNEILTVENPSAPGTFATSNADDTIHAGIEALVSAHVALGAGGVHAIEPTLSLAINEFRFDGDPTWGDNPLPAAPDYVLRGEIMYRNANGFYAGPTFDFVGERFADYANSYTVDSHILLGFRTGWSNDRLSVYVEAENLLDEEYVSTLSVRTDAAATDAILRPGAPFAVFAGMEWQF